MRKVVGVVAVLFLLAFQKEIKSQSWVSVQVNQYAKIDFPAAPNIMQVAGQKIYYLKEADDSTSLFMIAIADSLFVPQSELQDFYSNIIGTSVEKVNGNLISGKEFKIDSFSAREILFTRHMDETLLSKARILYCKNSSYVYSHFFTTNTPIDSITEKRFFESFRLSSGEEDKSFNPKGETTHNKISYAIGYHGAELIFFLLLIGTVVLCFRFIRKRF